MSLPVSAAWRAAARQARDVRPLVRLYYGDESSYLTLSTHDMQHDGTEYRGLLLESPQTDLAGNMTTHKITSNITSLKVNNLEYKPGGRFSDLIETVGAGSDIGFYNRWYEIRLWTKDITTWTGLPHLSAGKVIDIKQLGDEVELILEENNQPKFVDIADTLLVAADAADGVHLPVTSEGKVKQFVGGDHILHVGDTVASTATSSYKNNLTKALDLGFDASGNQRWLISEHKMEGMVTDESDSDGLWSVDSETNRLVELSAFTVEQNTSAGCIISHAVGVEFYDYWLPTKMQDEANEGAGDWGNDDRMRDGVFTTSSESAAGDTGDRSVIELAFPAWDNQSVADAQISEISVWARTYYDEINPGTPVVVFKMDNAADGGTGDCKANGVSTAIYNVFNFVSAISARIGSSVRVDNNVVTDDADDYDVFVYQVYKRITYLPTSQLTILPGARGYETPTYLDNRATTEGYTETHVDNDNSGALAEHPITIQEILLRDLLSFNTDEHLNENDFTTHAKWDVTGVVDDTGNDADWTFAGGSLNGTLIQTAANRLLKGIAGRKQFLKYTVAVTTPPDGDFTLVLTGVSESPVSVPYTAGVHYLPFIAAADIDTADFVITSLETTSTVGEFTLDGIHLLAMDYDEDTYNIASNDISAWLHAFALTEPTDPWKLLAELGQNSRSFTWPQPNGVVKIKVLEDTYSASVRTIDLAQAISEPKFTRTSVKGKKKNNTEGIATKVEVQYDFDGSKYQSVTTFSQDTTQQLKYGLLAAESYLKFQSKYIHSSATANLLEDYLLAQWKQPHNLVEVDLGIDHLDIDFADIVEFSNPPYKVMGETITANATRGGQTIYPYWWI
ncbi:MAG TPA: hypothetical protein ENI05_08870, partial [Porticoccus sp.]|nr:hypothetical protein [Porticoccus sp.]